MRDMYWAFLEQVVKSYYYYWNYRSRDDKVLRLTKIIIGFASSAGIMTWAIWAKLPAALGLIIGISQMLQVIQEYLPLQQRIISLNFLIPELKELQTEIEYVWNKIDNLSNEEINEKLFTFEQRYNRIESKFVGDSFYGHDSKIDRKAEKQANAWLDLLYFPAQEIASGKEN